MSDQNDWTGDLDESEIAEGLREASREIRDWVMNGFETDIRKRAIQIARERKEGVWRSKQEKERLEMTFKPDTDLDQASRLNARLETLVNLPHRNEAQTAEMRQVMRQLEDTLKKGGKK